MSDSDLGAVPEDIEAFVNSDQFEYAETHQRVLVGDHFKFRNQGVGEIDPVLGEMVRKMMVTLELADRDRNPDDYADAGDPPELPEVDRETDKYVAVVHHFLSKRFTWLRAEHLHLMEDTKLFQLGASILMAVWTQKMGVEVPDVVPDDVPKEEPQPEMITGDDTSPN